MIALTPNVTDSCNLSTFTFFPLRQWSKRQRKNQNTTCGFRCFNSGIELHWKFQLDDSIHSVQHSTLPFRDDFIELTLFACLIRMTLKKPDQSKLY